MAAVIPEIAETAATAGQTAAGAGGSAAAGMPFSAVAVDSGTGAGGDVGRRSRRCLSFY